jgi:hypothetical protein
MFFFHESRDPDLKRCWFVLGRLGPEMEASLSINGEVLFLFSPHEEFQRRSFNKLTQAARQEVSEEQRRSFGAVRFTPDAHIALIWSRDSALDRNLRVWNADSSSSLAARVPTVSGSSEDIMSGLRTSIATVLALSDLYGGKSPVTGRDFFGRLKTIQTVSSDLRNGRSVGLFGIRRSGKTSLLRELQRREEPSGLALVLSDLESTDTVDDIPRQISKDLVDVLRRMRESRPDIRIGDEREHEVSTFSQLSSRLIRVAERNSDILFVVAVDEIENLHRFARTAPEKVRLFLGSLRRAAQSTNNLSLFFTGITTAFFDQSIIADVDNPLFGFIDPHFLPPFTPAESAELVRELGKLMMLDWSEEALETVHSLVGGFPFLLRDLSSAVRRVALAELPEGWSFTSALKVNKDHVMRTFASWTDDAGRIWSEIVRTLEAYQPIMAEMVKADTEQEISEWRRIGVEGEVAAASLVKLGLLTGGAERRDKRSDCLIALRALGTKPGVALEEVRSRRDLRSLLSSPEGPQLEFKSTARWNLRSNAKDSSIEHAIVKTVAAFLNADGGMLVIGADDNGTPRGLVEDLGTLGGDTDRYERWLLGSLLSEKLGADVVAQHVTFSYATLDDHLLVTLAIRKCQDVVWVSAGNSEELYVRNGNETRLLSGRQAYEFARRREQGTL